MFFVHTQAPPNLDISERKELASKEYMDEIWDLDFRRRLGEVVKAYLPGEGETVQSILESYRANGLELVEKKYR